jgi:predicted nucleic-acid-binding protein
VIGLDTNVLARYYVDDAADKEAIRQRMSAKRLIESGRALMVATTVLLEFEWVLRGYYEFSCKQIAAAFEHLLALPQVSIQNEAAVRAALVAYGEGFDFADALHHASYAACESVATFHDKGFARKANKRAMLPRVSVPQ